MDDEKAEEIIVDEGVGSPSSGQTFVVYILTSDPDATRTQLLVQAFAHNSFDVKLIAIETPDGFKHAAMNAEKSQEYYRFKWVLEQSLSETDGHIIVIKDSSITNSSPESIAEIVTAASKINGFDLTYFSRYGDNCNEYVDENRGSFVSIANSTGFFAEAASPYGYQAIMISPHGRDVLLGRKDSLAGSKVEYSKSISDSLHDMVVRGELKSRVRLPNLFSYDVTRATKKSDYSKLNECNEGRTFPTTSQISTTLQEQTSELLEKLKQRGDKNFEDARKNDVCTSNTIIWVVIFVVIIAVIYMVYKKNKDTNGGLMDKFRKKSPAEDNWFA
jgi:hypothetical protein